MVTLPDTLQNVQKYIADYKVTSPVLLDCGQVIASYLKLSPSNPSVTFPHVFIIDKAGIIKNDYGYGSATASVFETTGPLYADIDKLLK
jgi:peroxiredoxin